MRLETLFPFAWESTLLAVAPRFSCSNSTFFVLYSIPLEALYALFPVSSVKTRGFFRRGARRLHLHLRRAAPEIRPKRIIKLVLGIMILSLALNYIVQYFVK